MQDLPQRMRQPEPLCVSNGTLEAVKWLALVLMTLDHVNRYLWDYAHPLLFNLGRTVMPMFAFVFAYNLARGDGQTVPRCIRSMKRLVVTGLIAIPPLMALGGLTLGWLPLNILFTLTLAAAIVTLLTLGRAMHVAAAAALFSLAGAVVEYAWFGVAFCLASYYFCRAPSAGRACGVVLACASLALVNSVNGSVNFWALAALPLIAAAYVCRLTAPRMRHLFYAYYPTHFAALWAVREHLR